MLVQVKAYNEDDDTFSIEDSFFNTFKVPAEMIQQTLTEETPYQLQNKIINLGRIN